MGITAGKVISILEELAPVQLQEKWDNSGLQVGNSQWTVSRVLLTLDVVPAAVDYAVAAGFDFILAHHPLIFHKLSRLDAGTPLGYSISTALAAKTCIYSSHTNLDVVPGGVSATLATALNLENVSVLIQSSGQLASDIGMGRVGHLSKPMALATFAPLVGRLLGCEVLRVSGHDDCIIQRVAVVGGSGGDYVDQARRCGADVLVTGDVGYHQALAANQSGLALIDPGHYLSELPVLEALKKFLEQRLPGITVSKFPEGREPMRTIVIQGEGEA